MRGSLPQRETRIGDVTIMIAMRRLAVYLTLVTLLVVSISAGFIASDWPHWCQRLGWCRPSA